MLQKCDECQLQQRASCFCRLLSSREREYLSPRFNQISLETKSLIAEDTLRSNPVILVVNGSIGIQNVLDDGRRTIAAYFTDGDILDLRRHHSTCRWPTIYALSRSEVCLLDPDKYDEILSANAAARVAVCEILREQVLRSFDHSVDLGKKKALEKIASFICECRNRQSPKLDDDSTVDFSMQQYDIADYLGLQPETVSRCLRQLNRIGVIKSLKSAQIVVTNPAKLKRLANGARL